MPFDRELDDIFNRHRVEDVEEPLIDPEENIPDTADEQEYDYELAQENFD